MKPFVLILGLLLVVAGLTWRFPLFHVTPLRQSDAKRQHAAFNAAAFAADFWTERLTAEFRSAADANSVVAALDANADEARQKYGRTVGLSRSTFFLVRGVGTIVAVENTRLGIALTNSGSQQSSAEPARPGLWLVTGLIFGNAVRDAHGLLKGADFPNSQHFNELSAALNARVESRVLPPLRQRREPGGKIRFVACVEVSGGKVKLPLELIPLDATFE